MLLMHQDLSNSKYFQLWEVILDKLVKCELALLKALCLLQLDKLRKIKNKRVNEVKKLKPSFYSKHPSNKWREPS